MPLKESHLIQIGKGEHDVALEMATVGNMGLLRNGFAVESIGINVLKPDYIGFVIPEFWTGEYLVNGESASQTSFFMNADLDSFHLHSKSRITMGATLPRQSFVKATAALAGVYMEDIKLDGRKFQLSKSDSIAFRSHLRAIIDETCDHPGKRSPSDISNEVTALLADVYLRAQPDSRGHSRRGKSPERIVRLAEERFMAARWKPVSMADLCLAAGVKKTVLYEAFQSVCGLSPLLYFQKQRLMQARSLLLKSDDIRGGVKQAALSCGFTELGRFSAQYQQLFGELPSDTLRRPYSPHRQ